MDISITIPKNRRKQLKGISSRAWEHQADRATLAALKKVPGLDAVLQRFVGATTEKSLRLFTLASAVRVTDNQFPKINRIFKEACATLDAPYTPELFVSQNPFLNASATGVDKPFIVLHSSMVDSLSEDEILCVLGHELGHIMSGHVLYKTLLQLLLKFSMYAFAMPIGGASIMAIIMALREWDRKSELSADRAGLLAVQDTDVAYTLEMKLAGGSRVSEMDMNEFFLQAAEYESGGTMVDSMHKVLNLLGQSHPFPVLRLTELKQWVDSGEYGRILEGQYLKREQEGQEKVGEEFKDAGRKYRDDFMNSKDPLAETLRNFYENTEGARTKAKEVFDSFFNGEKKS
jgi:Zn-dependent protease with chaperone function